MNKTEYLARLAALLAGLPPAEREDALRYYADYLDAAGEDADEAIRALGSPEQVAQSILNEREENSRAGSRRKGLEGLAIVGTVVLGLLLAGALVKLAFGAVHIGTPAANEATTVAPQQGHHTEDHTEGHTDDVLVQSGTAAQVEQGAVPADGGWFYSYDPAMLRELDVELELGSLEILQGKAGSDVTLEVEQVDGVVFTQTVKNGVLKLENKADGRRAGSTAPTMVLTLPQDLLLEKIELEVAAGEIVADWLEADELEISMDAGSLVLTQAKADRKAELSVGMGEIQIDRLEAPAVEAECEVGAVTIKRLDGSAIKLECELGEMEVTLAGQVEDYAFTGSCELGELIYGGASYGNIKKLHLGSGARTVKADCEMGELQIIFEK